MAEREVSDRPLVSVIIPFLNPGRFLDEAIRSVVAQSYPVWEIVLVDDGSTDGTSDVARRWAGECPGQVRCLAHDNGANRGVPASRNLGIRHAKGQLLAFLDADDVWVPDKLEAQIRLLRSHPEAGMVYGLSEWWYSWTQRPRDQGRDFVHELGVPPDVLIRPPELIRPFFVLESAAIPNPSDVLVRREAVDRVGGFEERVSDVYEDQAFYAKVAVHVPVVAARQCWTRYRQHPDSRTAVADTEGLEAAARRRFLDWLLEYLSAEGCRDTEVWRAVRWEVWKHHYPVLGAITTTPRRAVQRVVKRMRRLNGSTLARGRRWLKTRWRARGSAPAPGRVRFGDLRRVTPFSRQFGYERGQPIDRYYIERFLGASRHDVSGRVLEICDDTYTRRFGEGRVSRGDVLDVDAANPVATIVTDLVAPQGIPDNAFDCVIFTQTLLLIYEARTALETIHRALKPGGVMLATVPGISQISRYDMDRTGDYWRFTTRSAQRLCEEVFGQGQVEVAAHGNVLAASAFLFGLAAQELTQAELDHADPDYQMIVTIRAVKPPGSGPP